MFPLFSHPPNSPSLSSQPLTPHDDSTFVGMCGVFGTPSFKLKASHPSSGLKVVVVVGLVGLVVVVVGLVGLVVVVVGLVGLVVVVVLVVLVVVVGFLVVVGLVVVGLMVVVVVVAVLQCW